MALLPSIIIFLLVATLPLTADAASTQGTEKVSNAGLRAPPTAFLDTLSAFRPEGPRGWGYDQTTTGDGKTRKERFDPSLPESQRWMLLSIDERAPDQRELQDYRRMKVQRSSLFHAPRLQEQLDLRTAVVEEENESFMRVRLRLKPGDASDRTAEHLSVEATWHKASHAILKICISNTEPFSPVLGISLHQTRTELHYSLPNATTPSLPQRHVITVRGRAYWIKSIDQDLLITFSNHRPPQSRNRMPGN